MTEIKDLTGLLIMWEQLKDKPLIETIAVMQDRISDLEKRIAKLEEWEEC